MVSRPYWNPDRTRDILLTLGSVPIAMTTARLIQASKEGLEHPFPYSGSCDTFRPRETSTARTASGSIGLVNFKEDATAPNSRIAEHSFQV